LDAPVSEPLVLVERDGAVAVVTMNRPEARNAMNAVHSAAFVDAVNSCQDAAAIVLTGADPAFCAGLDLKEIGSVGLGGSIGDFIGVVQRSTVPVIGAVNGAAVTGGLELALACDFLIASERARFADTHGRVGVYPGGGMTVLLPQRIGVTAAREMSLTGNFYDARTVHRWGLVNHVVKHEELLSSAIGLARDMASLAPGMAEALRDGIAEATSVSISDGLAVEQRRAREHHASVQAADIAARRAGIMERSRDQRGSP